MVETHICEYCENVYPIHPDGNVIHYSDQIMVSYRPDPFDEEIRGDFTNHWLCDDCYYDSAMEI